jgi:hypothetical protein
LLADSKSLPNGKPFLNASPGAAYEAKRYALFFPASKARSPDRERQVTLPSDVFQEAGLN